MRRFLITSSAWTGEAEACYDADGRLIRMDVMNTDMHPVIIRIFKDKLSPSVNELATAFKENVTIVESSFELTFEMFWKKYNKKINRKRAESLWGKLSKVDQVNAFYGTDAYDKYLTKESWRTKADPDTYIRNRYWENEYK